jgi:hypothetical protein
MTESLATDHIAFSLKRELEFVIRGERMTGELFVGDLQFDPERRRWYCHWSLSFVHPEIGRMSGDDPMDALTQTFDFISSLIRGSEEDGLVVWWRYEGDHAGLTFPQSEGKRWLEMPSQKSPSA